MNTSLPTCPNVQAVPSAFKLVTAVERCRQLLRPCSCRAQRGRTRTLQLILTALLALSQGPGHARGLALDEQQLAARLAADQNWPGTLNRQDSHPLGRQTLFIEKTERKQTDTRLARVYQYDYDRQSARMLDIDLLAGTVLQVRLLDSVHLPLNAVEVDYARQLLSGSSDLIEALRSEQISSGRVPFAGLEELQVKASIHEPLDPLDDCALARCALLSLFDDSRTVFAIEPVVNLATGTVGVLNR